MSAVEDRLAELGLTVPEVAPPVAAYVPARAATGDRVYTSASCRWSPATLAATGKVGDGEGQVAPDDGQGARRRSARSTPSRRSSRSSATSTR